MNRFFLFLLAVLTLTACGKDADEPGRRGNQASERRELVSVRLSGDLELPYDDLEEGKALTLVPETRATGAVLTPTYEEGEQVEAVAYATSLDGTQSSGPLTLTLSVGEKGRKFFYHGDLSLPSSMVGSKIKFAVLVGFDPATGALKAYPTTAPHYAKTGTRQTIENYPIALQAKAEVDYVQEVKDGQNVSSYRHLGLRFGLVGSLIRCALTNDTDQELTVTGLELHGLGATGLKLAKPTSGTTEEVFVTSDEVDPSLSSRIYTLPAPKKLVAGAKEEYYLVYAPLVSRSDGRGLDYKGYVRPLLDNAALQAEYADGQTAKALPSDRGGKLAVTSVALEEKSPIQPNAIPLQYWNNYFYYKPSAGSATIKQPWGYLGSGGSSITTFPLSGYPPSYSFDPSSSPDYDYAPYYSNPQDVHANNVTSLGLLHVPTKSELDAIFLPEMIKEATDQEQASPAKLPYYYQSIATYTQEIFDEIEVANIHFLGKSTIWRDVIGGSISNDVLALLYQMNPGTAGTWPLGVVTPVYALRYAKLSPSEVATHKANGFTGKLARNNKSRVAYMYVDVAGALNVYSCYIGDDPSITTARDLYEQGVFKDKTSFASPIKQDYKGHKIYIRCIMKLGALYSSSNVNGGTRQRPLHRWDVPLETSIISIFPSMLIPPTYTQSVSITYPSSGLLYRKTSSDNNLVSGWFYRGNEGQIPAPAPVMGWTYDDRTTPTGTINKYLVKDLPTGDGRYFAFPLWLMSDAPSDVQR